MVGNRKVNTKVGPKKQASQFSLDIDLKGVVILLSLLTLTMATVFYMGMVYGKAQRDPSAPQVNPLSSGLADLTEKVERPRDLDLYQMKEDDTGLKGLQQEFNAMSEQADDAKGQVDAQVKLDQELRNQSQTKEAETAAKNAATTTTNTASTATNTAASTANNKTKTAWPDNVKATKPAGKTYFVQVTASAYKSRAEALVKQLRKKRFNAYIREVKLENRTLYRVRVGDNNLAEIKDIKSRLEPVVQGSGSKLLIYEVLK